MSKSSEEVRFYIGKIPCSEFRTYLKGKEDRCDVGVSADYTTRGMSTPEDVAVTIDGKQALVPYHELKKALKDLCKGRRKLNTVQ